MVPKKLSERDAWAIALTWRDQLQGCVRLETDSATLPASLVPVFTWITFVLNGTMADGLREVKDPKDTATSARSATLALFALSCCPGYEVHENPHFWRRVFSELHGVPVPKRGGTKKPFPYRPQQPISDAIRFFDGNEWFPRVRFVAKFPHDSASVRAFLDASETMDRKLLKALKRLMPFIRLSLWKTKWIPVALEGLDIDEVVKVMWKSHKKHVELLPSLSSPEFQVEMIVLRRQDTRNLVALQDLKTLTQARIVAEECEFSHLFHIQRGPLDFLLNGANHVKPLFSIRTLSLARSIGSRSKFAVACSSLPYMNNVARLDLSSGRFEVKSLGFDEWVWLGYAMFHPDNSEGSSFSELNLRLPYVRDVVQHLQAFKSMATGNNLLVLLGYDVPISSVYYKSRVPAGTIVRLDSADHPFMEVELTSASWCTLCVTTPDISKLGDWIQAVLPDFGLGWVRREDMEEIVSMPPRESCVRHLRLELPDVIDGQGQLVQWIVTPLLEILSVVGQNLVSLDMVDSLTMPRATVQAILERCPSLETLRVSHDGGFWKEETSEPQLPRLQELELCVDATAGMTTGLRPLRSSSLAHLRTLRVRTMQHASFDTTHRNFSMSLVTYPSILQAHWFYTGVSQFPTYEKRRLHSLSLQRRMDCGQSEFTQVPMRLDGMLAFLSVVHDPSTGSSALSSFGPDILRNLFSFSTSPEPRIVYVGRD